METWKDIPGYEGFYQASSLGRVKSLDRLVTCSGGSVRREDGQILVLHTVAGGYKAVMLSREGIARRWRVHRLVLMAFFGPPLRGMEGCHRDSNPSNNDLSNLRWDTHSGNEKDKVGNGTTTRGERNPFAKLNHDQVEEIKRMAEKGVVRRVISEQFRVSSKTIYRIVKGKTWIGLSG